MELNIDILYANRKKSLARVIFGIFIILFSSANIIVSAVHKEDLRLFDWLHFSVFTLMGTTLFVDGLGYSFESFFGKSYLRIDKETISAKTDIFRKEKSVKWTDIKSIFYEHEIYYITKTNEKKMKIAVSSIPYPTSNEIRKLISSQAREKNIPCNLKI
jgi:hypothetical protein